MICKCFLSVQFFKRSRNVDQTELFSCAEISINNRSECLCHFLCYRAFNSRVFALLYFHVPRCTIFVHISHKRHNFRVKVVYRVIVLRFVIQILSETFLFQELLSFLTQGLQYYLWHQQKL